jgi:serine phosphatase RsbU (regulator of sigma subunit)
MIAAVDTLTTINRLEGARDLARTANELVLWAREITGCSVALLRLIEPGEDTHAWVPACMHAGGSEAFLRDETMVHAAECLCGHVITGAIDPSLPFFTRGGAFVWGHAASLPTDFTQSDTGPFRGRCIAEGFESVAIFPIPGGDSAVGCLHLADARPDFFRDTAPVIEEVCRKAGPLFADRAALDQGLTAYRAIQSALAPPLRLVVPGFRLGVSFQGADLPGQAGGDFYDIIRRDGDQLWFVVGDYSGKGIDAMGMAARARYTLSSLGREADSPSELLSRANSELFPLLAPERFVAAALCRIDLERRTLDVALAGHPRPLLFGAEGSCRPAVAPHNPPLGAFPNTSFPSLSLPLDGGDLLLIATDGVTESRRSGRMFGPEGIAEIVRRIKEGDGAGSDPSTIAREVCAASIRHHDETLPGDDRLVLAAEML